ncbi:GtrA family protein [Glaciibacter superstes]|uniref:GtrA family protein n=1 Tax=Glaciibacter superstes TaxID=501023 RepID=UPI0003B5CCB2|nr:GtrA family protein [Glaciibacter superstes]
MDNAGDAQDAAPGILLRLIRDQRIAFLLVGAANTGVGFLLFIAFDLTIGTWLDAAVNPVVGSLAVLACAHVLGVLFAFVMYRAFVFKVRGHVLRDLARFESVYLVSIIINAIILPILVSFGWNRILAQFSILIVTTLISYFGHRSFSFRRTPAESEPGPEDLMLDPGAAAAALENHEHDPNHEHDDGRPPQKPGDT